MEQLLSRKKKTSVASSIPGISIIPKTLVSDPEFKTRLACDCCGVTELDKPGIFQIKSGCVVKQYVQHEDVITRMRLFPSLKTKIRRERTTGQLYLSVTNGDDVTHFAHNGTDCDLIVAYKNSKVIEVFENDELEL